MRVAGIILATAVLLVTTGARADWKPPSALEAVPLVLAEASLAIDAMQTMDIRHHPHLVESNPILGKHPGDARVVATFAAVGLATGALWYVLPSGWRVIPPLIVFFDDAPTVYANATRWGLTMRLPAF